ncbi:DUF4124 domain-containing protein [Oceanobacter mangrovi]|uniref:DUF4124 domain-containing protein n=1 Tax=Oceanobacter mangrovi TaxID=2862510 RepID=UPI001C8EE8ED|nr:DUF4124 domain-containing protein [Oceanobacter mangrovi]
MPLRFSLLAATMALGLVCLTTSATADVYRWVDEKGQVHFGSQPPRADEGLAERYDVRLNYEGQAAERKSLVDIANPKTDQTTTTAEASNVIKPGEKKENCSKGKQYMETLGGNRSRRFKIPGTDEVRPLTDDEYQQEVAKAKKVISENCN